MPTSTDARGGAPVVAAHVNPYRLRLARRLRTLRAASGLSGNAFAARIGWVQSRVSKLETGVQLPTDDDLRVWAAESGAEPGALAELQELLTSARVEYATWRDTTRRHEEALIAQHGGLLPTKARPGHIAEYQPTMIPWILQTAAYARELLGLPGGPAFAGATTAEVEALVGRRIRRQNVLYEPQLLIEIVVGEAALRAAPGTDDTMTGQLDRLLTVAELASVDLRIVPLRTMPIMPVPGFAIEDEVVYAEGLSGEQVLREPDETVVYRNAFEHLKEAAISGAEARHLVSDVVAEHRAHR